MTCAPLQSGSRLRPVLRAPGAWTLSASRPLLRAFQPKTLDAMGRDGEAEALLAQASRLEGGKDQMEAYSLSLAAHDVPPSDDAAARTSLVAVADLLAARGRRPTAMPARPGCFADTARSSWLALWKAGSRSSRVAERRISRASGWGRRGG